MHHKEFKFLIQAAKLAGVKTVREFALFLRTHRYKIIFKQK
jgi:hypothetical protein